MRVSMRVSLPLVFPALLVISTFQIIIEVSGSEDGIAAGALFSVVILPFLFAGYYLARDAEEIKLVRSVLPVLGFYPFIYAIKSPFSWILAGLVILIPVLSMRYTGFGGDRTEFIVFALSVLACLGMPDRDLSAVGIILVSLVFYASRKRLELQYIVSYGILWVLVSSTHKIDPFVFGMGIIFGLAVFVIFHYSLRKALERTSASQQNPAGSDR
ncbi:hypothetical protein [Thermococcus sp. 21S9]|uniref:hypothetical protein n=1 Tax=Thermococcus sp. 21S9 TaxID=1638223 RepID=UPI00143C18D0|nr:hypothetical protein [Thermococcus sp. 21S9]NJE54347.1 hypothetical protein [Thermococcus sp. 21S9]